MAEIPQKERNDIVIDTRYRTFTEADQNEFASFSRDFNPLHLDAEYARRTWAGAPVVYGINILLWAMEELLRGESHTKPWRSIRADFRAPVLVDRRCDMLLHHKEGTAVAQVMVGDTLHSRIQFRNRVVTPRVMRPFLPGDPVIDATAVRSPAALSISKVTSQRGRIHMTAPAGNLSYPHVLAAIGWQRMYALGLISMMVGMICPGLHSLLSAVTIDVAGPDVPWLDFEILEPVKGSQQVIYEVSGAGIRGWIEAMFRPSHVAQAPATALAEFINPKEFAMCSALVIGGSRGLGALTAKILAAGGATVLLTYAIGKSDAEAIQREIREAGGLCEIMRFNVLEDMLTFPDGFPFPSHAYYFATPTIHSTRRQAVFDSTLFEHFCSYYVDGLANVVRSLVNDRDDIIHIFNPVLSQVGENPAHICEYIQAKSLSEAKSKELEKAYRNIYLTAHRLPPMLTDQTARIVPVKMEYAVDVMLSAIRQFQGGQSSSLDVPFRPETRSST